MAHLILPGGQSVPASNAADTPTHHTNSHTILPIFAFRGNGYRGGPCFSSRFSFSFVFITTPRFYTDLSEATQAVQSQDIRLDPLSVC